MENKLKELSLHLLDLGKRNRLLNFKESGYRNVEILNKNIDVIFDKITNGQTLSFYQLDSVLEKYNTTIEGEDVLVEEYSKGKVFDIINPNLKANELLAYKKGIKLSRILKTIMKEYKNTLTEKGINTLYLSFGLVAYFDGKQEYFAPLLLIPIKIFIEKDMYKIKEYEDEVILNPTLSYLFQTEYKINLDDYIDQPLLEYFSKIKIVLEENNMKLINHIAVGLYSFLKMNMFNDLTNNKDVVLKNDNVLRLLGENIPYNENEELPIYPVVNADESQIQAIKAATNGKSFVLQGPPGSGKSQTITNIISSAIGNGKKVLFVSEKQAALNVVYENLRRVGLESFGLELHSHKANKKDFIDELYKTAILPKYNVSNNIEEISSKYKYLKNQLSEYRRVLHNKNENYNLSLYELYSRYLNLEKPAFSYKIENASKLNINDLNKNKSLIEKYINLAKNSFYDYRKCPFYGFKIKDLNFARYQSTEVFNEFNSFLKDCILFKNKINSYLPIHIENLNELLDSLIYVEKIAGLHTYKKDYFIKKNRMKLISILEDYIKAKAIINESTIVNFFDLKILNENIDLIYNEFKEKQGFFKFLNPTYHSLKKLIYKYIKFKMSDKELLMKLNELIIYKDAKETLELSVERIPKDYDVFEYESIYNDLVKISDFNFDLNLTEVKFKEMKNSFVDILIHFQQLDRIPNFDDYFDTTLFSIKDSLDSIYSKINVMVDSLEHLETFIKTLNLIEELQENKLLDYLHVALNKEANIDNLATYYEVLALEIIIYNIIDNSLVLKEFSGLGVESIIDEFKKLDEMILEMNKALIVSKLSNLRPDDNIMVGSEFSILVREYNKSRKQKPIRILLEEILELILSLKPVFLMSPLSVSTYLNSSLNMFDLVVFDEASQVFAWDALGSIYRAKQCIIIGDSKQMPPSNFFNTFVVDEESDDFDLESILDKGMTIFPTKQLSWHYRSRSEELIAFSNDAFYDSRLITIPQAKKHSKGFGIDFHYVKGVYEVKNRINKIEAEYIVDLIVEHYQNNKNQSLGVVAFSNAQAEYIEEILEKRLVDNKELISLIEENIDEPFFIKNLESVQGDERDRIIFSVCYGFNEENKFYQRFGPLNNVGGERRLNVAITRAKYNVCVVSSIKSSDIKTDNTDSNGVKLLKGYLAYAENITTKSLNSNKEIDGVGASVVEFLKNEGFLVQTNIGASSFIIDIAVMHPITKEYILAIMLDGKSYLIGNCSDANRLQEMLLNRLGWKYYRIFSTLWFSNMELEKKKLLNFVNEAMNSEISNTTTNNKIDFLVENQIDFEDSFMEYPYITDDEIQKLYNELTIPGLIDYIVRKEEPISVDFLLKRICFVYGRTKVTNVVRKLFEADLDSLDLKLKDGFLSTKPHTNLSFRINSNRSIEYVPSLELQDAIFTIVKKSNGIEKDGCFKLVAKLLGYSRMSENAYDYLENALVFLMLEGKIVEKENRLYI